jgi:hypothetical protein
MQAAGVACAVGILAAGPKRAVHHAPLTA